MHIYALSGELAAREDEYDDSYLESVGTISSCSEEECKIVNGLEFEMV